MDGIKEELVAHSDELNKLHTAQVQAATVAAAAVGAAASVHLSPPPQLISRDIADVTPATADFQGY